MRKWQRPVVFGAGVALLVVLGIFLFWGASPSGAKPTGKINWYDYEEGVKTAKETRRPIILHFYTDWCTWCKKMDADTFANSRIQEFVNLSFIPIKINPEAKQKVKMEGKEVNVSELARKFGVRAFPTTIFMEPDGKVIGPVPGYIDQDRMRKILSYVHEKAYEKMEFEEFVRDRSEFRATGH